MVSVFFSANAILAILVSRERGGNSFSLAVISDCSQLPSVLPDYVSNNSRVPPTRGFCDFLPNRSLAREGLL